ncbi:MAG: glycosyltransferase family 2 protein [Halorhabdus sp.]
MLPGTPTAVVRWSIAGVLWIVLLLYGFSVLWWWLETVVLGRGWKVEEDEFVWGFDDVQVRILTIDATAVVQATVDAVPAEIEDVRVIAEKDIDIDGAAVQVVPEDFECDATNKGRAVEWARRNVPCKSEYVLYIDEDTLMASFHGLPDADIVQFSEKPLYTGSRLAYLAEVFRVGYQFEQRGFHRLRYPLYAWGGGVAVRSSLEEKITWDVATITEDTNFIWRAADSTDISFRLLDARFRNQAPPSIRAMIKQRRRWISGTLGDGDLLPMWYRPLYYTRVVAWAFSPFVPLLVGVGYLFPGSIPTIETYQVLSLALAGMLFVYTLAGLWAYRKHPVLWPLFVLLTPVAIVVHSFGALWGLLWPVETFEVTEKVTPETIEDVHANLDRGDLCSHDGKVRLCRDSRDQYQYAIYDD